jgi:plasmid stability protein
MGSILIRRLDDATKARLKARAARHGHSMEEEARAILKAAVATDTKRPANLAEEIHARFAALDGVELPEIPREPVRRPPDFK